MVAVGGLEYPERDALQGRLEWLLDARAFPPPLTEYPYPWPMV